MWKTGKSGFRHSQNIWQIQLKKKKNIKQTNIQTGEGREDTALSGSSCQVLSIQKHSTVDLSVLASLLPSGIEPTRLAMLGIQRGKLALGTMSKKTWRSVPG